MEDNFINLTYTLKDSPYQIDLVGITYEDLKIANISPEGKVIINYDVENIHAKNLRKIKLGVDLAIYLEKHGFKNIEENPNKKDLLARIQAVTMGGQGLLDFLNPLVPSE